MSSMDAGISAKTSTNTRARGLVTGAALLGALALGTLSGGPSFAEPRGGAPVLSDASGRWASRTVWACDRRKRVVVEGVQPDERLPRAKAQQVASLLMDLMRFCDLEITAQVPATSEAIKLSVSGLPFVDYVPGGPLPVELAHNDKPHSPRELAIWQAELDKQVKEGDRLFHSDELGTNGVACAMCHPNASNTHPETYPKFQTQLKKVALVRDMVNWCIENPLEGKPLTADDPRMAALESYILASRKGAKLDVGKH